MKRLKKLIPEDTFYLVLFTCVCVVAASGVWVSKNNVDLARQSKKENIEKVEEIQLDISEAKDKIENIEREPEPELEPRLKPRTTVEVSEKPKSEPKAKVKSETKPKLEQKSEPKVEPSPRPAPQNTKMKKPTQGDIFRNFAQDKLIYSKTLEQWTTHNGIDIKAAEGTAVIAAMNGTIKDIKKDDGLGIVISIDHGNGLESRYANLATDEMVKKGQNINAGTAISKVGKGVGYELLEGAHLHFEVLKDGKHVDPMQYIN